MPARLRSMLFAPANRPDLVAKTPRSGPDAVVIDLEDGTPPAAKVSARGQAAAAAASLRAGASAAEPAASTSAASAASASASAASASARTGYSGYILLRVNSPRATDLFDDDLRAYASGPFDGLVVPKTETAAQVSDIEARLSSLGVADRVIVWGIESVRGVVEAVPALGASERGLAAYFGAEDYIAYLGGRRTELGEETYSARTAVAQACRLAGLIAIDQVVTALTDAARFEADAQFALNVGFGGKMCVHPAQVATCHALFTPSPEAVDRARRLLDCYDAALAEGRATANFEGQMIDGPLVAQARQVLDRAGETRGSSEGARKLARVVSGSTGSSRRYLPPTTRALPGCEGSRPQSHQKVQPVFDRTYSAA
ncbi:MAG: HpcH/HpaI aldolase/citrate lyase family protein [Trebonia sp.]